MSALIDGRPTSRKTAEEFIDRIGASSRGHVAIAKALIYIGDAILQVGRGLMTVGVRTR